jgi:hypothetical protein
VTFQLKPLPPESIPAALDKAERYRLLNEPVLAESICLDVLAIDPDNQRALVIKLLALTDQFGLSGPEHLLARTRALLPRLHGEYERHYYTGLISERRGKALLYQSQFGAGEVAYECLHEAMQWYEKAQSIHPRGNDDAILRYNTCVRLIERYRLEAPVHERLDYPLE